MANATIPSAEPSTSAWGALSFSLGRQCFDERSRGAGTANLHGWSRPGPPDGVMRIVLRVVYPNVHRDR
jgi:hypothetical protein